MLPTKRTPHKIEVEISEEGVISSEVKGVEGIACEEISKWLDSLGDVTHDSKTSDYHKKPKQHIKTGG